MWSNKVSLTGLAAAVFVTSLGSRASTVKIGCPATHDGKQLTYVGLFDGPPSERMELMPGDGRFVINEGDEPSSQSLPNFTLGCFYDKHRGDMLLVILPRYVRVCEFPHYPQVECH